MQYFEVPQRQLTVEVWKKQDNLKGEDGVIGVLIGSWKEYYCVGFL